MRAARLHPVTDAEHECPHCRARLGVRGWHVPGMRNLADLLCTTCGREFYGDLASGQALYTPMLLDKATGAVHGQHGVGWFAAWLRDSYARRVDEAIPFDVREGRAITKPVVLLNCLDTLYGHSLLKLLNAQYYLDRRADVDLVVMVPSLLAWMVPDGVAQVWSVGLPLRRGTEWNEWLAREVRRRVEAFDAVSLGHALSHPRLDEFDIERFTRVKPFPLGEWGARLERPTVTFIWRDDRPWRDPVNIAPSGRLGRLINSRSRASGEQSVWVSELADALRRDMLAIDFAVTGLVKNATRVELPEWVKDLRRTALDDGAERAWCERYAESHLVVGIHGSNMLLPSAHAGGVVEFIGPGRWGNFAQDVLFRDTGDCREAFFRYRFVDEATPPTAVAQLVNLIVTKRESFRHLMNVF
ncbi:MAG TPA: hypothetical protein VGP08_23515 [Pyrinomonadaceae bacterium]|jgi:hypothetical protein|nr:hypothetical protein [Pyrinomonadaceae bacterium]